MSSDATSGPRLLVAVLTYRRPDQLAQLLPLLREQAASLPAQAPSLAVRVDVLVVDNDPQGSGREVVATVGFGVVDYCHEPRPGISAARNRALTAAAGHDLLVFIDDDERPHPGWLASLVQTQSDTGAAAVAGAVVSSFENGQLDPWIEVGGFFVRRRLATGSPITLVATNNLLLDLRRLRAWKLRFDEQFGASGGSDTLLGRQIVAAGGRMVWCDEAVVTDAVPVERMTRSWVLRRAFRAGNTWSRTSLHLAPDVRRRIVTRVRLLGSAGPRVVLGAGRCLAGTIFRAPRHQARGARTLTRGLGMVSGVFGIVYREYRRKDEPDSAPASVSGVAA